MEASVFDEIDGKEGVVFEKLLLSCSWSLEALVSEVREGLFGIPTVGGYIDCFVSGAIKAVVGVTSSRFFLGGVLSLEALVSALVEVMFGVFPSRDFRSRSLEALASCAEGKGRVTSNNGFADCFLGASPSE